MQGDSVRSVDLDIRAHMSSEAQRVLERLDAELSVYDDEGRAIPSQGGTSWNGEAMQTVDYEDLDETPESVAHANALVAANAAHLATALREHPDKPSGA